MKPSYIFGAVIFAGLAFAAGYSVPMVRDRSEKSSVVNSVAALHPDIDFSSCRNAPITQVQPCLDAVLAGVAATRRSVALCTEVTDRTLQMRCVERVNFAQTLSGSAAKFCVGIADDPLCVDLATMLAANLENKREICSTISSADLRSACSNLFGAVSLPPPPAVTQPVDGSLPTKQFGLVCPSTDKDCLAAVQPFNAAILAQSEADCRKLGLYSELCLNELAVYRAYRSIDPKLCTARLPEELCTLYLTTARALDGQSELCDALTSEVQKQSCKADVAGAKGAKRFDYLTK